MAERSLKLLVAGDASGALKALGSTGDASEGLGHKLASMGKKAALALGAAGVAAAAFAKSAIDAAAESQKISKVTEQIVKSTAGAAKISAEEVGKLATALSNKTGIDDEAIQSAQNLILTFKNVRNEVGKGNDIFNRASALALDLSTVMGNDASGAAMQLAKALDNPVKGVNALARSGVSFTAQQKEQIKTLVESGKTLEAQKIILKEVESQVGGTAAAQATAADRAKVAFGNLQEQIGMYLLPVVEKVSNYLVTTFIPKLSELADKYGPAVGAAFQRLGEIMKPVFEWLQVNVPIIFDKVKTAVSDALAAIMGFWNKHKEDILRIVGILWETLKGVIDGGIRVIKGIIDVFLGLFQGDWSRVWNGLKGIVSGAWDGIVALIKGFGSLLWEAAKYAFDKVVEGAVASGKLLFRMLVALPGVINSFFAKAGEWLLDAGENVVEGLIRGMRSKIPSLIGMAKSLGKWIVNPFGAVMDQHSPSRVMMAMGEDVAEGLIIGMTSKQAGVEAAAVAMASSITGPMAGEAARNGGKQLAQTMFAAMAGEAARNGTTVYTPLISSMAGESARNGNKVAKPLFAAMAGEAARNGANQIAGALRTHLEVQARDLGYDLGAAIANSITESIDDVEDYFKKFMDRIDRDYGTKMGPGAQAAARDLSKLSLSERYAKAGGGDASWWESQLANLADWNNKVGNTAVQVRSFAPSVNGTLLTDKSGNYIYADETDKITEALNALIPQMGSGGIVTAPTLAMIGESGPEAIIPLGSSALGGSGDVYLTVTGSVVTERDLVETVRKALIVAQQQGKTLVV